MQLHGGEGQPPWRACFRQRGSNSTTKAAVIADASTSTKEGSRGTTTGISHSRPNQYKTTTHASVLQRYWRNINKQLPKVPRFNKTGSGDEWAACCNNTKFDGLIFCLLHRSTCPGTSSGANPTCRFKTDRQYRTAGPTTGTTREGKRSRLYQSPRHCGRAVARTHATMSTVYANWSTHSNGLRLRGPYQAKPATNDAHVASFAGYPSLWYLTNCLWQCCKQYLGRRSLCLSDTENMVLLDEGFLSFHVLDWSNSRPGNRWVFEAVLVCSKSIGTLACLLLYGTSCLGCFHGLNL